MEALRKPKEDKRDDSKEEDSCALSDQPDIESIISSYMKMIESDDPHKLLPKEEECCDLSTD